MAETMSDPSSFEDFLHADRSIDDFQVDTESGYLVAQHSAAATGKELQSLRHDNEASISPSNYGAMLLSPPPDSGPSAVYSGQPFASSSSTTLPTLPTDQVPSSLVGNRLLASNRPAEHELPPSKVLKLPSKPKDAMLSANIDKWLEGEMKDWDKANVHLDGVERFQKRKVFLNFLYASELTIGHFIYKLMREKKRYTMPNSARREIIRFMVTNNWTDGVSCNSSIAPKLYEQLQIDDHAITTHSISSFVRLCRNKVHTFIASEGKKFRARKDFVLQDGQVIWGEHTKQWFEKDWEVPRPSFPQPKRGGSKPKESEL